LNGSAHEISAIEGHFKIVEVVAIKEEPNGGGACGVAATPLLSEVACRFVWGFTVDDDMSLSKTCECEYLQHSSPLSLQSAIFVAFGSVPRFDVEHVIAIWACRRVSSVSSGE
jgi:hypothetical protein